MYRAKAEGGNALLLLRRRHAGARTPSREPRRRIAELRSRKSNSFYFISRRSISRAAASSAPRRCCVGTGRGSASSAPACSCRAPKRTASSCRSTNGFCARPAARPSAGSAADWAVRASASICRRFSSAAARFRCWSRKCLAETGLDPRRLDLELTESIVMEDFESRRAGSAAAARPRRQHLDRRFRHRLFVAELRQAAAGRPHQDRPELRAQHGAGPERRRHRSRHRHARPQSRACRGRRRRRDGDQLAKLRDEGCDEVQGYYFGRPMPAREFHQVLAGEVPLARTA